MSVNFLISQAKNIQKVIDENASEIEALDQNIGDGDHIFNIQRGLKLVIELEGAIKDLVIKWYCLGSSPNTCAASAWP